MSELLATLPSEYVELLRDMARDGATSQWVREALEAMGDDELTSEIFPVPSHWRPDDYALFCADPRVWRAEFERRVCEAIDEQLEAQIRMGDYRDVSDSDRYAITEWVHDGFLADIDQWRRHHPDVRVP
ncbi:hypothetical protein GCM10009624_14220 [Gordonia sinesedis]